MWYLSEKENFVLERIKQLCEEKQMSRYQLAQRSGLAQSSISAMINRNAYPSIITLEKICKGFGITLAQFFTYEGIYSMLTEEDREMLILWNSMDTEKKAMVKGYMHGVKEK